jgi:hypothetical protein
MGSGGSGTIVINSSDDDELISRLGTSYVLSSEYYPDMLPINQHAIVTADETYCLPISAQLVKLNRQKQLIYIGGDFSAATVLSNQSRQEICRYSKLIGRIIAAIGYRGCIGIDYLVDDNKIWMIEINPRFQASTRLLNRNLLSQGLPSVYELHIKAFNGELITFPLNVTANGAFFYSNISNTNLKNNDMGEKFFYSPDSRDTQFSKDSITIMLDQEGANYDKASSLDIPTHRVEVDRQILGYLPGVGATFNSSILGYGGHRPNLLHDVVAGDNNASARFKFELFSYGLKIHKTALDYLARQRGDITIRDGIAGGLELCFNNNIHVNVPIKEFFSLISPYSLEYEKDNGANIVDQWGNHLPVNILQLPDFVGMKTSLGTPMVSVGQMFNERLSIEIAFGCINNASKGKACKFCELGAETTINYAKMEDIAELIAYCESSNSINMRHMLIGGGTPPDSKLDLYCQALSVARNLTSVPIYMMLAPPKKIEWLDKLKELGLAEIGFNIEFYNRQIARAIMPNKGLIELNCYLKTMERAVELWGNTGNVRSIMIVGIEPLEDTLKGVKLLASRGVLPILSPFRPIPGTPMASHPQANSDLLFEAWLRGEEIAAHYGLTLGPTCIACQNNTLAMPFSPICRYY